MVENYTKDIKESIYHGAVVSALAVSYTMLRKTLIKMSPPSLSKFDIEDGVEIRSAVNYHFLYDTLVGTPTPLMRISNFPMCPFTNDLLPSSLYNLTFMKCPNCTHPSTHWTFHNPHNLL